MFADNSDLAIFLFVVGLRLIVPLFIPRYPLPAIIAALVIDAVDQTVFQRWTSIDTGGPYQSYDKALDVYYLAIAYLATMRNWNNLVAFEVSRFLIYYRLIGVAIYETVHWRPILFIFPNTFEYFFIFVEAVRMRWNPKRMPTRVVIGAAAFIWIFIKLPQEYWIHIAQRDVTDTLREYPWLIPVIAVALVALVGAGYWIVKHKCPPADWSPTLADPLTQTGDDFSYSHKSLAIVAGRGFDKALFEKIALVSLVCYIFGQMLPNTDVSAWQLTIGISTVIIGNMLVTGFMERRNWEMRGIVVEFLVMLAVNGGLALLFIELARDRGGSIGRGDLLFFLFLVTLIITLYDMYRPYYRRRLEASALATPDQT